MIQCGWVGDRKAIATLRLLYVRRESDVAGDGQCFASTFVLMSQLSWPDWPTIPTRAPSEANAIAVARPMPLAALVKKAIMFVNRWNTAIMFLLALNDRAR